MKFKINNTVFFVKWNYERSKYAVLIGLEEYTTCKIYDNTTSFDNPIAIGEATKAAGDRFCKNTGRKISLDRALNNLFPNYTLIMGDLINIKEYSVKARAIAWAEYFKESPYRLNKQYYVSVRDIVEHLDGISKLEPCNEREQAKLEFCKSLLKAIKNNRLK